MIEEGACAGILLIDGNPLKEPSLLGYNTKRIALMYARRNDLRACAPIFRRGCVGDCYYEGRQHPREGDERKSTNG